MIPFVSIWRPTLCLTGVVLALGVGLSAAAPWHLTPEAERLLAPDFALPDLAGGRWRLYEAQGRPVLLNFAATWCPPCRDELPALVRLYEREGPDGIQVVAIFIDRAGRADVAPFAAKLALPFPVLLDPRGPCAASIRSGRCRRPSSSTPGGAWPAASSGPWPGTPPPSNHSW